MVIRNGSVIRTFVFLCQKVGSIKGYFNALENITRRLIGRRKFVIVNSVIYCRKPDFMSNVACDWSP